MLSQETTIGIYPNGELNDVLIVPDGHEFHLFLTGTHGNPLATNTTASLGSIVIINNNWLYEGDQLELQSQREIADYILNYPDEDGD
jgi:hypothetical protein